MADTVSKQKRSQIMAAVKSKDTKPEKILRSFLHGKGLRYRLHVHGLPGRPDIVFPRLKTLVFMHGCFWHGHHNCKLARIPKSNVRFWKEKIESNMARDKKNIVELKEDGWRVLTIWECQLKDEELLNRLTCTSHDKI